MNHTLLPHLVQRIREELEEAPGLRLTVKEAARFWGLEETTCQEILTQLVATGFLAKGADDRYRALCSAIRQDVTSAL